MFKKEHKKDWIVLVCLGVILIFLFGFNLKELSKTILTWGFALIGFKLLFEYGIISSIE